MEGMLTKLEVASQNIHSHIDALSLPTSIAPVACILVARVCYALAAFRSSPGCIASIGGCRRAPRHLLQAEGENLMRGVYSAVFNN
eukprot:scaffold64007_cov32-Tisochrysis_lutea.AAC.1